jgi:hypothetical protein
MKTEDSKPVKMRTELLPPAAGRMAAELDDDSRRLWYKLMHIVVAIARESREVDRIGPMALRSRRPQSSPPASE